MSLVDPHAPIESPHGGLIAGPDFAEWYQAWLATVPGVQG